jgi:hypothetical protein
LPDVTLPTVTPPDVALPGLGSLPVGGTVAPLGGLLPGEPLTVPGEAAGDEPDPALDLAVSTPATPCAADATVAGTGRSARAHEARVGGAGDSPPADPGVPGKYRPAGAPGGVRSAGSDSPSPAAVATTGLARPVTARLVPPPADHNGSARLPDVSAQPG